MSVAPGFSLQLERAPLPYRQVLAEISASGARVAVFGGAVRDLVLAQLNGTTVTGLRDIDLAVCLADAPRGETTYCENEELGDEPPPQLAAALAPLLDVWDCQTEDFFNGPDFETTVARHGVNVDLLGLRKVIDRTGAVYPDIFVIEPSTPFTAAVTSLSINQMALTPGGAWIGTAQMLDDLKRRIARTNGSFPLDRHSVARLVRLLWMSRRFGLSAERGTRERLRGHLQALRTRRGMLNGEPTPRTQRLYREVFQTTPPSTSSEILEHIVPLLLELWPRAALSRNRSPERKAESCSMKSPTDYSSGAAT